MGLVKAMPPLDHRVLYPKDSSFDAIPKYISRKTSYIQV